MLLTEEQEHVRDTAREFAQSSLAPYSAEWESKAEFPRAALRELGKLGFMGMTVPPEWDGAGTDYVAYALALEEVAAGDGAVSTIMSGHNSVGCMPLVEYGTPAQKEKYLRPMARGEMLSAFCLTEPQSGSDAGEIRTRAERRNGAYILNGTKQFVTSGKNADVALVIAATDLALGKQGISCFIVDTKQPGYRVRRVENKMGQQASDTCEVQFDELSVPVENRLGAEGQGYRIALANLEGGRIGIAAQAVGMARAAFEIALAYAQERRSFGKTIIEHQAVAFPLGRHGDPARGRASARAACRRLAQPGLALPQTSLDGEIVRHRSGRAHLLRRHSDAGRRRIHGRLRGRAHLSRRARQQDLRGHQRHSAAGHQPRADELSRDRKGGTDRVPDTHRRCCDHADAEPSSGECDQRRMGAGVRGQARPDAAHAAPFCISAPTRKCSAPAPTSRKCKARMDAADGPGPHVCLRRRYPAALLPHRGAAAGDVRRDRRRGDGRRI